MAKEIYLKKGEYPFILKNYVKDDDNYIIISDRYKYYIKYKVLHRIDGPAIEYNGSTTYGDDEAEYWYQYGKLHRKNGPAVEYHDGCKQWYQYGKLHRIDGPAMITKDGHEGWYYKGKLHRENGPSVIYYKDKIYMGESWWYKDKLHRLDGPALEIKNLNQYNDIILELEEMHDINVKPNINMKNYFIYGVEYDEEKYYKIVKKIEKSEKKLVNKYARVWYEKCDHPGSLIWNNRIEKGWEEINNIQK